MQPSPDEEQPDSPTPEEAPRLARTRRGYVSSRVFSRQLKEGMPRTWVTDSLVAANCLIFLAMVLAGISPFQPNVASVLQWGGDFGPLTMRGEPWRLLSSGFLHLGIFHLAMNMLCLLHLGRLLERLLGRSNLLAIYFFALLASSLTSIVFLDGAVGAGASGAVFGLAGALFSCMRTLRNVVPKEIFADMRIWLGLLVVYNVLIGSRMPSILNSAHVGGLIAGYVATLLLCRLRSGTEVKVPLLAGDRRMFVPLAAILALGYVGIEMATRDWPLHRTFHDRLAMDAAVEREDHEAVIACANRIVVVSPEDAIVQGQRGLSLAHLERWEEALPAIQLAVRHDPGEPFWHGNLAWVLTSLKRHQEAVGAARDALRLDSGMLVAHEYLLISLAELDDNEAYLKAARKAKTWHDDSSLVLFHLSWAEHLAGNVNAAIKAAEAGLLLAPDNTWAQGHLKDLQKQRDGR